MLFDGTLLDAASVLGCCGNAEGVSRQHLVGVVVATRDRRDGLLATLGRLVALPEAPPVVVVDNGSSDGTADAVRASFPSVHVIDARENLGAAARTRGARVIGTPYVAFADDDSWWAPGALTEVARLFDDHPRLGLVQARILVGPAERLDPVCAAMARGPLPRADGMPGTPILGFVACGAAVRREAFLAAGGFDARFGVGGEEAALALALASDGWALAYVDDVVAHHHPGATGPRPGRLRRESRNHVWSLWLRRPVARAAAGTLARLTSNRAEERRGALDALGGLHWVLRERRVVPPHLERAVRLLES